MIAINVKNIQFANFFRILNLLMIFKFNYILLILKILKIIFTML